MAGETVTLQIPKEIGEAIAAIAGESGRDVASIAGEMLAEAVKMRRVRGIVFASEYQRREAKVGGTGLGVWEVIEGYHRAGQDWEQFRQEMDWLNDFQLRAALEYWRAYPDEIDEMIRENQSWTEEKIWATYPETRPSWVRLPETSDTPAET